MRLALLLTLAALLAGACARSSVGELLADDAGALINTMNGATADDAGSANGGGNDPGGGSAGSGSSADAGAASSDDDAGDPVAMCPAPTTSCSGPEDLGEVAGNADGSPLTRSGAGTAFFKVTVSDDDSNGFVESAMGIGAKLTAGDASDNYDLFLYRDGDTSCADDPFVSANPSGEETLSHIWNAAGPTAGETRVLMLEVRQVGASCGTWSLEITPHPCSSFSAPGADNCAEL